MTANKFDDVEPLSLGTFDDKTAKAPYLNTPRSLEACRRFGVNPVELVELSARPACRRWTRGGSRHST